MEEKPYQGKPAPFDNTREALAYIGTVYGTQVLLSEQLKALLTEVAPNLSALDRNRIHAVIYSGAADILKAAMDSTEDVQEKTYDQGVKAIIDDFGIRRDLVEEILTEYIDTLGWEISAATPLTEVECLPKKPVILTAVKENKSQPELVVKPFFGNLEVGPRNIIFGKYKWRVLDVKDGKALLLSEDILEKRAYHHEPEIITWEKCDLRRYLNGEFLRKFKEEEQRRVAMVTNINEDNQWFKAVEGNDTKDKVFILSLTEVTKYFGDSGKLLNPSKEEKYQWFFHDQYSDAREAKYGNVRSWWWLRSTGGLLDSAAVVNIVGDLSMIGYSVDNESGGVRPALWLNL
jgi:hypothetical protein